MKPFPVKDPIAHIAWKGDRLLVLDQRLLPRRIAYVTCRTAGEVARATRSMVLRGAPLIALSAETGQNCDRLMPAVFKLHGDWSTKVKTRDLNDWLAMAVQRHPPPAVDGKRIRPK